MLLSLMDGTPTRVEAWLKKGADANAYNEYGIPALFLALGTLEPPYIESLLRYGADPKRAIAITDKAGWSSGGTLLHYVIKSCLANYRREDFYSQPLKSNVVAINCKQIVKLLTSKGVDINAQDDRGRTASMAAVTDYAPPLSRTQVIIKAAWLEATLTDLNLKKKNDDGDTILDVLDDAIAESRKAIIELKPEEYNRDEVLARELWVQALQKVRARYGKGTS